MVNTFVCASNLIVVRLPITQSIDYTKRMAYVCACVHGGNRMLMNIDINWHKLKLIEVNQNAA